jgi:dihydroorotate dehydrogenase electron transfer subunit
MTHLREVPVAAVDAVGSYRLVRLAGDVPVGVPGQFVMIRDPDRGALLARPVGLFRTPGGDVACLVDADQRIGVITQARRVVMLGPLGVGFDLNGATADTTLMVAGGIGITVFPGVAAALGPTIRLIAGFRSPAQTDAVALVAAACQVVVAPTLVTGPLSDALADPRITRVLACGPAAMIHAVADRCAARGVACQVGLEAPMGCGFGACYGCVVRLDGSWKRLCLEGPIVDAARLA